MEAVWHEVLVDFAALHPPLRTVRVLDLQVSMLIVCWGPAVDAFIDCMWRSSPCESHSYIGDLRRGANSNKL